MLFPNISYIFTSSALFIFLFKEIIRPKTDEAKKRMDTEKNFNQLYNLFAKKKLELHMSVSIATLFDEIGMKAITRVLKFTFKSIYDEYVRATYYIYENQLFKITLLCEGSYNEIDIAQGDVIYNYEKATTNLPIKENFLKFFEERCKNEKIRLKPKKK
ncbi:MAG: hypothetical protein ACFFDX_16735 [Candidatus Odinarchaeota archaeon]